MEKKIKLSEKTKAAIVELRKYPNAILMDDGYLTGGHGVFIGKAEQNSLIKYNLIDNNRRLTDLGKTIEI